MEGQKRNKKVCVLGAGISGICQALAREEQGDDVTVYEKQSQVGGVLKSKIIQGYLLDYGANTLSLRSKKLKKLFEKFHILEQAIDADHNCSKRFIVRNSKIIALPTGFFSFLNSPFLSFQGKLRLLIEPFIRPKNFKDETMASFIERRLGKEVLEYAANPFVGGVYASKPESLLLKHAFPSLLELEQKYGSLFKGIIKGGINRDEKLPKSRLISFQGGMQELPILFAKHLARKPVLNSRITTVLKENNGRWRVFGETSEKEKIEEVFDEIISTLPSHCLTEIEWKSVTDVHLIGDLAQASSPPLALTFLGYSREQIRHPLDGFGFLVPEVEKRNILGTLFSSTLFKNRAPKDKTLLTSFIGGERNPELFDLADDEILSLSISENQKLLGIQGNPEFSHLVRWPNSIPLPDQSTSMRLDAAKVLTERNAGLVFSGSHILGAPLPNCIT